MSSQHDFADAEIHGLARYFPTTLSKGLLIAIPTLPTTIFVVVRGNPEWFLLANNTLLEQTLLAILMALIAVIVLSFILILDLSLALNSSKHRRIVHYSNEHPLMSVRWLFQNSKKIHWLLLAFLSSVMFALGYYAQHP